VYTYLLLATVDEDGLQALGQKRRHGKGLDSGSWLISSIPSLALLSGILGTPPKWSRLVAAGVGKTGPRILDVGIRGRYGPAYFFDHLFGHLGRARELSRQASKFPPQRGRGELNNLPATITRGVAAFARKALFGNANRAGLRTALAKERSGGPR